MQQGATVKISLPATAAPFTTVQRVSSPEGLPDRNRPHFHPDTIEICAVIRGQLDWFVAEESHVVGPGELLVIPANVVHGAIDSNLQPCELVVAHLAPEQLPPSLTEATQALSARRLRQPEISTLVGRIFDEHERGGPLLPEVAAALGTLLIVLVLRLEEDLEERKNSRLIRQVQRALMGGDGARPTVDEVAHRLGVSSVWLHKLFVRETGASPGEWARAKRLSEAKRMLEEGLSTGSIAMILGYRSGQSFATAFRKESGMTPSDYREIHTAPASEQSRKVYCVSMRESWLGDVRVYPPD